MELARNGAIGTTSTYSAKERADIEIFHKSASVSIPYMINYCKGKTYADRQQYSLCSGLPMTTYFSVLIMKQEIAQCYTFVVLKNLQKFPP